MTRTFAASFSFVVPPSPLYVGTEGVERMNVRFFIRLGIIGFDMNRVYRL